MYIYCLSQKYPTCMKYLNENRTSCESFPNISLEFLKHQLSEHQDKFLTLAR